MKKHSHVLLLFTLLLILSGCNKTEYIHVGPNWDALNKIKPSENTFSVNANAKEKYRVGDKLEFTVSSFKEGKLWIVKVDPDDSVEKLFPNEAAKDNSIKANIPLNVPGIGAAWSFKADKPLGKSVVVFIVTTGDTDLDDVLGQNGNMAKALRLVQESPQWGLEKHVIDVIE